MLFLVERRFKTALTANKWLSSLLCFGGFVLGSAAYFNTATGNPIDRIYGPTVLGLGVFFFLLGGLQIPCFQKLPLIATLPGELSYGMYLYHPLILYLLWPICWAIITS